jgi:FkbM family methyltransferase
MENHLISDPALDLRRPLLTTGRHFSKDDTLVVTVVFHWYTPETGSLRGPWPPIGGRKSWTGEPDWWKDQVKQMMLANFDVIYVHLTERWEEQRVNLFRAYADLRAEGYDPPAIAPFLDPSGIWPSSPIDVATSHGKDAFVGQYIRFFKQYFDTNNDSFAGSYLARIEDRLVLSSWYVADILRNLEHLERTDVEQRLTAAFADKSKIFANGIWMTSTACIEPDLSFSDERMVMFSGLHYCIQCTHNGVRAYHLQAGYWDQNIRRPGIFMPRAGGRIYKNIWDYVIETIGTDLQRVYVESWNEYDEGSGIYAADPEGPHIDGCNASDNSDFWSSSNDPFEYIRTTRLGASRINKIPDLDAKILSYQSSIECAAGSTCQVQFHVRNQGNALWTGADGIGFGVRPTSASANLEYRFADFDIDIDEIAKFGGIFRGRPVKFTGEFGAPSQPGTYKTRWSMFSEKNGVRNWFGEEIELKITVTAYPVRLGLNASPRAVTEVCRPRPTTDCLPGIRVVPFSSRILPFGSKTEGAAMAMSRKAVIWGYRYLLGREPESEEVIRFHMESTNSAEEFRQTLMNCAEFKAELKMHDIFFEDGRCYPGVSRDDLRIFDEFIANPTPLSGFVTDFIGSRTRGSSLWDGTEPLWGSVLPKPQPGDYHAEAIEWVGVLKSVRAAEGRFVAMELGAGHGPWLVSGAVAARTQGIKDIRLLGVEADPGRFALMQQHLRDNGFDPGDHMLIQAGVGIAAGTARWPRFVEPRNSPGARPLRASLDGSTDKGDLEYLAPWAGDFIEVDIVALDDLLLNEPLWDLVHIDVQGTEVELCQASSSLLSERVRYIVVGTHSRKIDGDLLAIMKEAGWLLEHEKPARFVFRENCPSLELMTVIDGSQVWRNPRV